ncbi:hypothetical protein [Dactylosporangium sp. CA-092794]|uniref:hypothetical protein n=1 Tax=Dactylosporangium sp. CA-092794 TaxID=3239929 RepID=UPI003D8DC64B
MVTTTAQVHVVRDGPAWAWIAADSLTDTLAEHPLVTGWLTPGGTVQPLTGDVALLVESAVATGGALVLEDRGGVLAWTTAPAGLSRVAATRRAVVDPGYARRWAQLEDALHSTVPAGTAGQLLLILAVAGTGVPAGRRALALFARYHHHLDAARAAAHTAAFDGDLVRLLRACGWVAERQRTLPGGLAWWPLHRLPAPTPPSGQVARYGPANSEPVR